MSISNIQDGLIHLLEPKKAKATTTVKLINKGYIRDDLSIGTNGPYKWVFERDSNELAIIYNKKSTNAPWLAYINKKLQYMGTYTGIIQRFPYLYNYIGYM
jgi:hypothetical protein